MTPAPYRADDDSPQSATVNIEGVPVTGIIDTGSDITIISGDMFKTVIAKARLKKEEFKTIDKQVLTYNKQLITLDRRVDINISFEDMFKTVIAKAGLKKEEFKTIDKQVFTYNKQLITLDGRVDINISFEDKQIYTTVYVKMEAPNQLLLSEAVCRQLGII